jgi:uncharacterized MAPEG superfamily protein
MSMSFAFAMILLAAVAPYVTVGFAKAGGSARYDNAAPRDWAARQDDWRARAIAAHQNHFEAFAPFAAAVVVATLGGADPAVIDALAASFILLRVVYTLAYVKGAATLRSMLWSLGFLCVLGLFAIGL